MMTKPDYEKKRLMFVFTNEGEKVSFSNDNVIVSDQDGNVIHQSTCYRIFALFIIGHITITSAIIEKAHKFCFSIYLMTPSFRTIDVIGHRTEGNTQLRKLQYTRDGAGVAKHIIINKIRNQCDTLALQRVNDWKLKEDITSLNAIMDSVSEYEGNVRGLMGLEGNAARIYFRQNFNNTEWSGRKPRIKDNIVNATLDIGYTLLFNYIDAMLSMYGFDTYCGMLHTEFYLRKSLTCDLVEPFRPLIDWQVRKAINLGQIKEEHFTKKDNRYLLKINFNKEYLKFLIKPIMDNRVRIFLYFQSFYRNFMKCSDAEDFPVFRIGEGL